MSFQVYRIALRGNGKEEIEKEAKEKHTNIILTDISEIQTIIISSMSTRYHPCNLCLLNHAGDQGTSMG